MGQKTKFQKRGIGKPHGSSNRICFTDRHDAIKEASRLKKMGKKTNVMPSGDMWCVFVFGGNGKKSRMRY